ncbi:MAG: bifunctional ADP-dependent NAD(P)H-hydrate dehydratase/NAD(P)H-hydrate epimerase [Porticoccaceae bacterium]|nr:bifunctional ADP-dependent NAD(P)H-hydrate dehydratase/NAD(P)H-hydrate epimerase [Porticoccaceae bacterium]
MSLKTGDNFLYDLPNVERIEQQFIKKIDSTEYALALDAAEALFQELTREFGQPSNITVFCGGGKNAADGYLLSALASAKSISVKVFELGNPLQFSPTVARARELALAGNAELNVFTGEETIERGLIVDALIGIGLRGKLREKYRCAIRKINFSNLPTLSIDVPSGLNAGTGGVLDIAVNADLTVTFLVYKQGFFTGHGPSCCGSLILRCLGMEREESLSELASASIMHREKLCKMLPSRLNYSYKTNYGHVLVIGGDYGYAGAGIIAAQGAARTGAGLVSLATRPEHISAMLTRQPEVMAIGVSSGQELEPFLSRPSVLVLGPGLGISAWSEQLLHIALDKKISTVIDADALNIISSKKVQFSREHAENCVITPHPGEAARLLDISVKEVELDRVSAAIELQNIFGTTVVLKGSGTIVCGRSSELVSICPYGNPGMASAGMGDLLSGVIGGLLAQSLPCLSAAELGCCLHSYAADLVVDELGEKGLLATDLLRPISDQLMIEGRSGGPI